MRPSQIRHQQARLESALARCQRRLKTHFHFLVEPGKVELLELERTARGVDDRASFLLYFNPAMVAEESSRELLSDAYHEVLHALTWPMWEVVKGQGLAQAALTEWENAIYHLERSTFDLVFPPRRKKKPLT